MQPLLFLPQADKIAKLLQYIAWQIRFNTINLNHYSRIRRYRKQSKHTNIYYNF